MVTLDHQPLEDGRDDPRLPGVNSLESSGRAAYYVDRNLKGERTGRSTGRALPAVGVQNSTPGRGGLLSFGHNASSAARCSTTYVDCILQGARPGDLPIEQPTCFELVLNLKTAKLLGITLPRSVMARATERPE